MSTKITFKFKKAAVLVSSAVTSYLRLGHLGRAGIYLLGSSGGQEALNHVW